MRPQPGKLQLTAAEAFIEGTKAVPDDWRLTFREICIAGVTLVAGAPRTGARGVLRASRASEGLTVAFGVRGDLELQWRGYQPTAVVRDRPSVKAWRIKKI